MKTSATILICLIFGTFNQIHVLDATVPKQVLNDGAKAFLEVEVFCALLKNSLKDPITNSKTRNLASVTSYHNENILELSCLLSGAN